MLFFAHVNRVQNLSGCVLKKFKALMIFSAQGWLLGESREKCHTSPQAEFNKTKPRSFLSQHSQILSIRPQMFYARSFYAGLIKESKVGDIVEIKFVDSRKRARLYVCVSRRAIQNYHISRKFSSAQ
jgi:hypothetical protein